MKRKAELIIEDLEEVIDLLGIEGYPRICNILKEAINEIESSNLELQKSKDILASKDLND